MEAPERRLCPDGAPAGPSVPRRNDPGFRRAPADTSGREKHGHGQAALRLPAAARRALGASSGRPCACAWCCNPRSRPPSWPGCCRGPEVLHSAQLELQGGVPGLDDRVAQRRPGAAHRLSDGNRWQGRLKGPGSYGSPCSRSGGQHPCHDAGENPGRVPPSFGSPEGPVMGLIWQRPAVRAGLPARRPGHAPDRVVSFPGPCPLAGRWRRRRGRSGSWPAIRWPAWTSTRRRRDGRWPGCCGSARG